MTEIRKDILFQQAKAKHLEDYAELPHRIYEQEYDRIRANVALLESVLQRAMDSDGAQPGTASTLESPKFVAFRRATTNLSMARMSCDAALEVAYPRYIIEHKGAFSNNGRGREEDLPEEKTAYAEALAAYERGGVARNAAALAESLSNEPLDESTVAPLTAMVTKARSEYLRAARFYRQANDVWSDIGIRNAGKAYRAYYGERVAPGE
jgi:hypothetical protein